MGSKAGQRGTANFTLEAQIMSLEKYSLIVPLGWGYLEINNPTIISFAHDCRDNFQNCTCCKTFFKVIPQYCIAHLYCARFSRHQRTHMSACSCKTWRICLDFELCQLKNGYSAPTSMGTPTFFLVIVINLS